MLSFLFLTVGFMLVAFLVLSGLGAFSAFILPPLLVMYIVQRWYEIKSYNDKRRRRIEKDYDWRDVY